MDLQGVDVMEGESVKSIERIVALLTDALAIADREGERLLGAKLADCLDCATVRLQESR